MWLVEEWTRHESATSVLVEPLSWGKSRSRDTTARAVASHGAARGCPRTPWNSTSMIPVRDTPRTHLVPKRSLSAADDPQSRNQPARGTGKTGHNRRTSRPPGARHPDDPQSPPLTARSKDPPERKPNRERNHPRHQVGSGRLPAPAIIVLAGNCFSVTCHAGGAVIRIAAEFAGFVAV